MIGYIFGGGVVGGVGYIHWAEGRVSCSLGGNSDQISIPGFCGRKGDSHI